MALSHLHFSANISLLSKITAAAFHYWKKRTLNKNAAVPSSFLQLSSQDVLRKWIRNIWSFWRVQMRTPKFSHCVVSYVPCPVLSALCPPANTFWSRIGPFSIFLKKENTNFIKKGKSQLVQNQFKTFQKINVSMPRTVWLGPHSTQLSWMGILALGKEPLCERLKIPPHLPGGQKEIRQQIAGNWVAFPTATLLSELDLAYSRRT